MRHRTDSTIQVLPCSIFSVHHSLKPQFVDAQGEGASRDGSEYATSTGYSTDDGGQQRHLEHEWGQASNPSQKGSHADLQAALHHEPEAAGVASIETKREGDPPPPFSLPSPLSYHSFL